MQRLKEKFDNFVDGLRTPIDGVARTGDLAPSRNLEVHAGPWEKKDKLVIHTRLASNLAECLMVPSEDLDQNVVFYSRLNNDEIIGFIEESEKPGLKRSLGKLGFFASAIGGGVGTAGVSLLTGFTSAATMGTAGVAAIGIAGSAYLIIKTANDIERLRDHVHRTIVSRGPMP